MYNETFRRIFLILGAALCLFLVFFISKNSFFGGNVLNDDDGFVEIDEEEDLVGVGDGFDNVVGGKVPILDEKSYDVGVYPDFIQKNSFKVVFEDFFVKCESDENYVGGGLIENEKNNERKNCDLHFILSAEDLLEGENESKDAGNFYVRSPVLWYGTLYLYGRENQPLFLCGQEDGNISWSNEFCIGLDGLSKYYFGQKIRLVYTTKMLFEYENLLPTEIAKMDQTFVFEITLPEEIYNS